MTIGGVEYRSVVKNVQYWLVAMLGYWAEYPSVSYVYV
ncbi:hypothetical protein M109_1233 [Bacteroides fragilis str. 3397 N2]|nr:hypothetical protein M080_0852 [Bacteroides fragilis str. 3397 T10]EXZ49895.1 hypothetical protein M109_1233 [Bacteroides fragilis str. 3397 N2]